MTDQNKGLCILIIEDNPGDQFLIAELLNASVLKIRLLNTAETLAKAIDLLQKEIFDIILLDLSLPDSSGIDTFKAVKKVAGKMPVIILSGFSDMNLAVEAITLGAQDYHIKGDLDDKIMTKTILYSIERKRRLEDLRESTDRYITISKADLDLMQSEEITRQIMKAALDAIIVIDTYGKITVWNPQAEKIFGWKQREILGKTLSETIIPAEYREAHERGMKHYLVTGEGPILNKLIEITALNREGKHFPVELSIIPLSESGRQYFCAFVRDITEIKKTETGLKHSNERFEMITRTTNDAVWEWNLETGKIWGNEIHQQLYGLTAGDPVPDEKQWQQRLHPDDRETMIKKQTETLASDSNVFITEYRFNSEKEGYINIYDRCYIVRNPEGKAVRILGSMMDITERKKAELTIKESEEKYRTLFEQSPAGIYQATLKGKIIDCNDAFALMLGYGSFAELPEKKSSWFYFSDTDRDISIAELLKKGELINQEIILKHKDGSPVYLLENCFLRKDIITGEDIIEGMMIDITEQKKSAIALRESEEKYRAFFENSMDGILLTTTDGGILAANPAACVMFGMSEEEICLAGRSGIIDKDDQRLKSLIQQRQKAGKASGELNFARKDGSKFPAEVSSSVFIDATGKEKTSMIIRDISERKRNEDALKKTQQNYISLVNTVDGIVWEADAKTFAFSFVNEKAERLLGYPVAKWINEPGFWANHIHPDDRTWTVDYCIQCTRQMLPHEFEYRMVAADGRIVWLRDIVSVIVENNEPVRLRGIMIDITEQKRAEATLKASEQNLQQVLSSTADNFYVIDRNCNITLINESAEKNLSKAWGKPVTVGINIIDAIPQGKNELLKNSLDQVFAGKKIEYEVRQSMEGLPEWVLVNYMPVNDDRGSIIGAYIVTKDISERKKVELALKESEEKYRSVIEQATDFIMITDRQGNFIDGNSSFYKTFGYTKEELLKLNINNVIDPEQLKTRPVQFDLLVKGEAVLNERRMIDRSGAVTDVEANVKMLPDGRILAIARDISDRKKAEEEILKTNARFQVLSKATSDIIWDWNLMDDSLWWNDNYYSLLGIKKEKEITVINDWYERIHPADLNRIRKDIEKGIRDNITFWSHEYRFAKADGSYLHFLDRSFIMRNPDGKPYRMIGSMVNMTPIHEAQRVVTESENRLQTIFDSEPQCIKLLGSQGELLDMNPAGLAMIEADSLDQVKGQLVLNIVDEEYRKDFARLTKNVFNGRSGVLLFSITGLKGTRRWLETHAVPMKDAEGNITALLGVTMDVTDKKKAEEELVQNEEKYRTMIEQAPDGIFISNKDTFFVDVNTSGCIMLGYTKKELLKMRYLDLISPENLKNNPIRIDELSSGRIVLSERKVVRKDGSEISIEINAKLRPDGMYQSFIRDITDRNKAEQAVKESEEKYRTLVEQAVDAIALYDATGKILDVNTGSVNLLGYTKEELMQMSLTDILTPEEIKLKPVQYDVLQKGDSTIKQRMMKKKDGSMVQTEVRSQKLPDGRFLSVIRDLTERIKAQDLILKEKQLSNEIIDSIPGVFFVRDKNQFLRWNKQFEIITGYSAEEISKLQPVIDFYDEGEREKIYETVDKIFTEGSAIIETAPRTKDGKKIPFYFNTGLINYEGKQCMVATGIDISDRKKAEQELEDSYVAIRRLTDHLQNIREEERAHIAREIHDELGQQLTVMKMDISWINKKLGGKDEPVSTRITELLLMLDETVKSVRRISSELRPSLLDDLGLTAAMEWQLSEFEKRFDIKSHFKFSDTEMKLPETIKTGLFRIFQESLTNVARHSKTKKVAVTLNQENNSIVLSITDDGVGFDKQKTAAKKTLGILGMKERTAMIGGTYEIITQPGKGTRVVVKIPLGDSSKN